jgi:hypothetical protein
MHDLQLPIANAFLGRHWAKRGIRLNPWKANPRRMPPMEMPEGKLPNLRRVVTFNSPCMIYRQPGKTSLKNILSAAS